MAVKKQPKPQKIDPEAQRRDREGTISVFLGALVFITIELLAAFHFNYFKNRVVNATFCFVSLVSALIPALFITDYIFKKKKMKMGYSYGLYATLISLGVRGLYQLFFLLAGLLR
jgi:hypothetical protein